MSFRYRLVLFLVVILVAVQTLTAAFAYFYLRQNLVERAKHELTAEMVVFTRQLDFLSERVTDAVKVSSLDYALRVAIAQHNRDTEISALRNHSGRIGAARMMLVGLDGVLEMDTASSRQTKQKFAFPSLLGTAATQAKAAALVAFENKVYWVVVVPVRAPVPIAYIAAFIPVDGALLDKLQTVSAQPHGMLLAVGNSGERWRAAAQSRMNMDTRKLLSGVSLARSSSEVTGDGHHYLTVTARLETDKDSSPVIAVLSYSLDDALTAYLSVIVPLLLLLVFALVVAVIGAMVIVRGVSRPVETLASAARRIAAGDYTAPPTIAQRDEIGHLADALIAMTRAIAEREAALKHAADAAEIARNHAVRASEAKSQFLANMTHELRTPLNAIVGFSEMLEQQVLGPIGTPRYVDYARDIRGSGKQLLRLVERMLDLAEAESNRLTLAKAPVRPAELLQQALVSLKPLAQKTGVALTFVNALDGSPLMEGDATRLRQAFTNLLHNALKFTPAGGEVRVSGYADSDWLSIRITDSGVGIAPDLLANVVRPFHRLRSALDGQHQGAGLGLPFAKAVIELHGGTLDLISEVGSGTAVTVGLPVRVVTAIEAA